jgi:hypothetical protein
MRLMLQVRALPREVSFSWNGGTCRRYCRQRNCKAVNMSKRDQLRRMAFASCSISVWPEIMVSSAGTAKDGGLETAGHKATTFRCGAILTTLSILNMSHTGLNR